MSLSYSENRVCQLPGDSTLSARRDANSEPHLIRWSPSWVRLLLATGPAQRNFRVNFFVLIPFDKSVQINVFASSKYSSLFFWTIWYSLFLFPFSGDVMFTYSRWISGMDQTDHVVQSSQILCSSIWHILRALLTTFAFQYNTLQLCCCDWLIKRIKKVVIFSSEICVQIPAKEVHGILAQWKVQATLLQVFNKWSIYVKRKETKCIY